MKQKRCYQQNCALAISLDVIGDRWSLLIVRELLIGERQFTQLLRNLPGLGTNLLTDRLSQLVNDGVVLKKKGKGHPIYRLSTKGEALKNVVFALIQWGMSFTDRRDTAYFHAAEWDLLPLRSVFNHRIGQRWCGAYKLTMDETVLWLECVDEQLVLAKSDVQVVAEIHFVSALGVAIFNGDISWQDAMESGELAWKGEQHDVELFLQAFHPGI